VELVAVGEHPYDGRGELREGLVPGVGEALAVDAVGARRGDAVGARSASRKSTVLPKPSASTWSLAASPRSARTTARIASYWRVMGLRVKPIPCGKASVRSVLAT